MPFLTDMYHDNNKSRSSTSRPGHTPAPEHHGFDPEHFARQLRARIAGQESAIRAVTRAVTVGQSGLNDPERPLGNVLLAGPTGVGKTELVRRVAAELRASSEDFCRIDMSALAQEHYAASFSGAPPGYAGSKESYSLFDKGVIEGDPYTPGIVLFDEIEKADRAVLRALLHILDNGHLRLANGQRTISFRNCYVFLTSNLGSRALLQMRRRPAAGLARHFRSRSPERTIRRELERFLEPEFFNRIDETVVLHAFTAETAAEVTRRELDLLAKRLARRSVTLTVSDAAVQELTRAGFDPAYGARGLRRAVRSLLSDPLARGLLRAGSPVDAFVSVAHGEVCVEVR